VKYNKILISGNAGSGKTYLANKLSKISSAPYIEIDKLRWKNNWTRNNDTDFLNKVEQIGNTS